MIFCHKSQKDKKKNCFVTIFYINLQYVFKLTIMKINKLQLFNNKATFHYR